MSGWGRVRFGWAVLAAIAIGCGGSGGGGGGCPDGGPCGSGGTGKGGTGFGGIGQGGSGFGGIGQGGGGFGNTPGGGGFGNTPGGGGFGNAPGGGGFGNAPGGGGFGNTPGGGGFGGGVSSANLGRPCATDAECGNGLFCAKASSKLFDGEGPPKGLCTADCTSSDSICTAISSTALCVIFENANAYCFEGCSFGPASLTNFDPKKCHGRPEMACSPFFDSSTGQFSDSACFPRCNSNADCGSGLYCSPRSGMCTSTLPSGKGIGEVCTVPDGGIDSCKGNCTNLVNDNGTPLVSICTEGCTTGASPSCGWSGTGPAPSACLYTSTAILDNGGPGIGDAGTCGLLCDCNSQCKSSALVCKAWTGANAAQLQAYFSRKGYCGGPTQADGGTDPGIPICN